MPAEGFAQSLVRQVLFAAHQVAKSEQTRDGLNWLKTELPTYWAEREKIICTLDYLAALGRVTGMTHWQNDAEAAGLLAGAVRNDHMRYYAWRRPAPRWIDRLGRGGAWDQGAVGGSPGLPLLSRWDR